MKRTPEGEAKREICDYLATLPKSEITFWVQESVGIYDPVRRIYLKKNSPYQRKGVSDICGIFLGAPMYIEVKAPGSNNLSKEQQAFLVDVESHGALAFMARTAWEVKERLDQFRVRIRAGGVLSPSR